MCALFQIINLVANSSGCKINSYVPTSTATTTLPRNSVKMRWIWSKKFLARSVADQRIVLQGVVNLICSNYSFIWRYNHKSVCLPPTPQRNNSLSDLNDTASTLKSIRRSQDDFEIITRDNKAELGKGSYGCVKLVRDK